MLGEAQPHPGPSILCVPSCVQAALEEVAPSPLRPLCLPSPPLGGQGSLWKWKGPLSPTAPEELGPGRKTHLAAYLHPCIFWSPHCAKPPENWAHAGAGLAPGDPGHPLLWLQAQAYSLYS